MHPITHPLVADYLDRLEAELADLPPARSRELVTEIEDHIQAAQADVADPTDADVLTLLDRLGDPADIASEAREQPDVAQPVQPASSGREIEPGALVMLLVGSVMLPLLGWLIG